MGGPMDTHHYPQQNSRACLFHQYTTISTSNPYASGPLADYLGPRGDSKGATDLLNGTLPPSTIIQHLKPETVAVLEVLAKPPMFKTFKSTAQIMQADFIGTYKASKESTSSSPSGRHIGHYKAVTDDPELVEIHSGMMSLPHLNGFSPSRWQKVVNIMLEKQMGIPKIHCLRIIALMESDFNHSNRILFGRQLGFHMEDNNLVSEMQFGSRPGKQCTCAVLHKLLCYDITRHTKETAAFIKNDTVGCFDSMVNNLLILCLRRLGMKPSATQSLGLSWAQCTHYIRTQFGISSQSYSNTISNPLFGPGQGSTIEPFLWILCYCLMVDSMKKDIPKYKAVSSNRLQEVCTAGLSFVDETGLGASVPASISQPESGIDKNVIHGAVHRLQTLAQHWEKLLYSTSGAINYLKSAWFVIAWKWVNSRAKLVSNKEIDSELNLTEGNNQHTSQVPQMESNASFKTLGTFISPSGSAKVSKQKLRLKSAEFAQKIGSSFLSRQDAYWAYLLYFIPQIGYSLPVMTFTQDECNFIQSPALCATLSKLHLNQNTARSIIFGPSLYGGLSIPALYPLQGIGQLQLLVHHLSSKDEISSLILIDLSYIQLLTGATTPFL